jgi:hypothetical protein
MISSCNTAKTSIFAHSAKVKLSLSLRMMQGKHEIIEAKFHSLLTLALDGGE